MTARIRKPTKRTMIIITCILGVCALGTAGFLLYSNYTGGQGAAHPISDSARADAEKQVKDMNMAGDATIAETYLGYIKADRLADAQKFFKDAVSAEADTQKKVQLLLQQQRLALSVNLIDQALSAAEQAVSVAPTGETYAAVASIYDTQKKYAEAVDYWQKAYDTTQNPESDQSLAGFYIEGRDTSRMRADLVKAENE